jgi:tetrapyrrole methylase family protein / MazG family protein
LDLGLADPSSHGTPEVVSEEQPAQEVRPSFLDPPNDEDRRSVAAATERLVALMTALRGPDGCAWDRKQTLESLKKYLLEETHEVLEALDEGSVADHCEELGDLLLQVVFQSELRREEGKFDFADVAHGIVEKLIVRHPHVFGDETAMTEAEALAHWEERKRSEKAGRSAVAGVPRRLPALMRAARVGDKASQVGFDWPSVEGAFEKAREEWEEWREAVEAQDSKAATEEFGDLLFSLVNVARFLRIDAEAALQGATDRFAKRFQLVEQGLEERGSTFRLATEAEVDSLWEKAKASTRKLA